MDKQSILFILPFMPYPLESGGHQALFNGIKAVKDEYNVLVAYPAINNEEYLKNESAFVKILPEITVLPMLSEEVHLTFYQHIYKSIKAFVKRILKIKEVPYTPNIYDEWIPRVLPLNSQWGDHLESIFSRYKIDVAQVEMPNMIAAVYNIPSSVKKVFVHHEIAFVRHQLELGENPSKTALAHADLSKMVEINLLNKYDAVITLSQMDKQKLINAGVTVPIFSSFAVVDTSEYRFPEITNRILSFVGPETHSPNYEGVMWFLNNCWKELKALDDTYRFQIIGLWSEKTKAYILSHFRDVDFMGFVHDLGQTINGTIMIVPINIGSGIRMKILEAASIGVPIVSTTVGVEGLPFVDGVQCIIKDDPDGFVYGILSLQDQNLVKSMCEAANKVKIDRFSVNALKMNREQILLEILSKI